MKPLSLGFLLAGFLFLAASPLLGQANPPLATPHFELYQPYDPMKPPMGVLGLPLGTFAIIEGEGLQSGKLFGPNNFEMRVINGKKLSQPIKIAVGMRADPVRKGIEPGNSCVLHGYERGGWQGAPILPRGEEWRAQQGPGNFHFDTQFFVTSIEKVNGVTVIDARPLDLKVGLAEPNFTAKPDNARPISLLGLPLGTFAIIQVHSPAQPLLMESPFQIDTVNGKALNETRYISIPGLKETKGSERVTLHGFETGLWECDPILLPKSENPSGTVAQQSFQFSHQFVITTPLKSGG